MKTFSFVLGGLLLCALASMGASLAAVTAIGNAPHSERIPIYFPMGEPRLTPEAQSALDETARRAHDLRASRIVIVGYAVAQSEAERERTASARAYMVQQSLIERGISPHSLYVMASAARPEPSATAPAFIAERRADVIIERGRTGF
ncbi:MAG TPA: OmpA family protein [Alphaproteobacteria bacterium]|nr:OmpA family protein [Alphaproteobacteria bacterium]